MLHTCAWRLIKHSLWGSTRRETGAWLAGAPRNNASGAAEEKACDAVQLAVRQSRQEIGLSRNGGPGRTERQEALLILKWDNRALAWWLHKAKERSGSVSGEVA